MINIGPSQKYRKPCKRYVPIHDNEGLNNVLCMMFMLNLRKNSLKKGVRQMLYLTLNVDVLTLAQRLASVNKM